MNMQIVIELTEEPIAENINPPPPADSQGAWLEFRGIVRGEENGQAISALRYEAYPEMAVREIRRILESLALKHPCLAATVVHRIGTIPVGETAVYVGISSPHRGEGNSRGHQGFAWSLVFRWVWYSPRKTG